MTEDMVAAGSAGIPGACFPYSKYL